jgi:pimeloyl-ACP methyl ester carboxylesterase
MSPIVQRVRTGTLEIACEVAGPVDGVPAILLHGWPYDPRTYDAMVPPLVAAGCRTIVPYLRGFGPTRFLSEGTPRSGQQAALGQDLIELMNALSIERAILVGYDWGGRAACIVAALWPERVRGLVTGGGYNMQDIARSGVPASPDQELRFWYQYYFNTERGRAGLAANRREFCRLIWQLWSPNWSFDDATFARTASSFDNPDFVEVTIHSYRQRRGRSRAQADRAASRGAPDNCSADDRVARGGERGHAAPDVGRSRALFHRSLRAQGFTARRP